MMNRPLPTSLTNKTALVLGVRIVLVSLLSWYLFCLLPTGSGDKVCDISLPTGSGVRKVAADLKAAGMIRSSTHFILVSRLRGQAHRLKAGDYRINDGMSPGRMLRKIVSGEVDFRRFALPEGYSIYQAAELLEQKGIFKKEEFLSACRSPEVLTRVGDGADSVEGYLYPATYNLPHSVTPQGLVEMMLAQFEKTFGADRAQLQGSHLSPRQVVILASIIEKEAVTPAEKPLIASVFHNRLRLGMPLQSDPTAVYGFRAFSGKVTKNDILRRSPYNTYLISGMPPGPIGNPGADAIKAVLQPAQSDYLYFVARKDGTHHFSRTLQEHNQAVARFLR